MPVEFRQVEGEAVSFLTEGGAAMANSLVFIQGANQFCQSRLTQKTRIDWTEPGDLMKKLTLALLVFLPGAVSAHAAGYTLYIKAAGIACTLPVPSPVTSGSVSVNAWSWGAATPTSGSNGGTITPGKPSLSQFSVSRITDECSAAFLDANLNGKHLDTVTMTQYQLNASNELVATMVVTLTNALLTSYSINGSTGSDPSEQLGFAFERICLANQTNKTSACYAGTGF
jgi:type VI protein secretion system component Hcp